MRRVFALATLPATIFLALILLLALAAVPFSPQVRAQPAVAHSPAAGTKAVPGKVILSGAELSGVRGLAMDAAGDLYISLVASPAPAKCISTEARGAVAISIFSNCASAKQEIPSGIAATPQGGIYLANRQENAIRLLDMQTGKVAVLPRAPAHAASRASGMLHPYEPAGLGLDTAGNLYVADEGNDRVLALAPGAGEFHYVSHVLDATAVAADSSTEKLFVASPDSNQVFEVDAISGEVMPFAGSGALPESDLPANGPTTFSSVRALDAAIAAPEGVALDAAGNLFIADTGANQILRVDAKSGLLSTVPLATSLGSPGALAINRQGDLFVADRGNDRILDFAGVAAAAPSGSVSISPASYDFGDQATGGTSAKKTFTLANSSANSLSLTNASFSFGGPDPNDFQETNNCVPSLAAGASCDIFVTFVPEGTGVRSATLEVSDADPSSPQTATISGTGDNYQVTVTSTNGDIQFVNPGDTAKYSLQITPDKTFTGTVTPHCPTVMPNTSLTCAVSPASLSVTAGQNAPFTVTVATQNTTLAAVRPPFWFGPRGKWWLWGAAFLLFALLIWLAVLGRKRIPARRLAWVLSAFAVLGALAAAGCGGSSTTTNPNPTNPGTYTFDVSASAQGASRAITLTLHVE